MSLLFDQIFSPSWSPSQVVIIFGYVPIYFLTVGLLAGFFYQRFRLKRDLRKLFLLWVQYFSFSILGGSFVTSFIDRGNMRIFWEYMQINPNYLPLVAFIAAALLVFFGTVNLWKFLNIAPSSEINKDAYKRFGFLLCVQVVPLLIFFTVGFILYPNNSVVSRFYSSAMIWVPVSAGLIASMTRDSGFSKVPAFKESEIRGFQPIYLGLAALIYAIILLVS